MINSVLDFFFPRKCVFCQKIIEVTDEFCCCSKCINEIPVLSNELKYTHLFDDCICYSALYYTGEVRESFLRYKFFGAKSYSKTFSRIILDELKNELTEKYDCITWVPISNRRLRYRGYDQSKLLAVEIGKSLNLDCKKIIKKTKNTKAQSTMTSIADRKENVYDAFEVVNTKNNHGKVLLIDDIITTGATMRECASLLYKAGAKEVICISFARAGNFNLQ